MPTNPKTVSLPCETEQLFWARRAVRRPSTSPADLDRAEAILRKSSDWLDIGLAKQLRDAKIAANRISRQEADRAKNEVIVLPLEPQSPAEVAREIQSVPGLLFLAAVLSTVLLATAVYSAASVTIAANAAQIEAWRAVR